jgi:hypothetical protein
MTSNPTGSTIITDAQETSPEANGEFQRFEAVLSGLVQVPKKDTSDAHDGATTER